MKKLILAGVIAAICSGSAVAADDIKTEDNKGVRFNTAIGPFYDPIFDFAGSVIPTFTYEIGDATKTSSTKLFGIYGTNGNWVLKSESENYFGANNDWYVFGDLTYTYAKLDVENFMKFGQSIPAFPGSGFVGIDSSPTVEVEQNTIKFDAAVAYQVLPDFYIGPSFEYTVTEFERDSGAPAWGTVNMITDKERIGYGIRGTLDKRNNMFTPTKGMYAKVDVKTVEVENTDGAVIPNLGPAFPGLTLNGTEEFENVVADLRYYLPLGSQTTLAWRGQVNWNSDEAAKTSTSIEKVAHGFTMEISGRYAYGTDLQLRHWLTDKIGVVGGASLAQAKDRMNDANDDVHYAGNVGVRYMLNPADGLSMRLDVAYNDQEDDNLVVFFNVGETF